MDTYGAVKTLVKQAESTDERLARIEETLAELRAEMKRAHEALDRADANISEAQAQKAAEDSARKATRGKKGGA